MRVPAGGAALLARCALAAIEAAIAAFKAIVWHAATPQDSDLSGRFAVPFGSVERSKERVRLSQLIGVFVQLLPKAELGICASRFQGPNGYALVRYPGESLSA